MPLEKRIYVGRRSLLDRLPFEPRIIALAVTVLLVIIVALFAVSQCAFVPEEPNVALDAVEDTAAAPVVPVSRDGLTADEASAAVRGLDGAPTGREMSVFTEQGVERTVDPSEVPAVQEALAAFTDAGYEASFVVYDLSAGRGFCCNIDADYFSASTIKAPFVAYLGDDVIDEGQASKSDVIEEDIIVEGTGIMATDDETSYSLEEVVNNTIVYSDNTGYALLREHFAEGGFEAWAARSGVDAPTWEGEWYPFYSTRDLAKLWAGTGAYVGSGAECSDWCAELLASTNASFIRQATEGVDARVLAKAGFEIDTDLFDMGALNDAGIVETDGGDYIVAVMSDADYDDVFLTDHGDKLVALATALVDARTQLLGA